MISLVSISMHIIIVMLYSNNSVLSGLKGANWHDSEHVCIYRLPSQSAQLINSTGWDMKVLYKPMDAICGC